MTVANTGFHLRLLLDKRILDGNNDRKSLVVALSHAKSGVVARAVHADRQNLAASSVVYLVTHLSVLPFSSSFFMNSDTFTNDENVDQLQIIPGSSRD
jgi:hypothetical protein